MQLWQIRVSSFSVLIHYVFAQTVVPWLEFILSDQIIEKWSLYVTISVKTASFIIYNNVVLGKNVSVAKIYTIVKTVSYYIAVKFACWACENNKSRSYWSSDEVLNHCDSWFFFHYDISIFVINYFIFLA